MPELPEVETVVRSLRPHLVGRSLDAIRAADRRVLRSGRNRLPELSGRTVAAVERIGKFIRIEFSPFSRDPQGSASRGTTDPAPDSRTLILTIHLGMAGRLLVVPGSSPVPKHAYFRLGLGTGDFPKVPGVKDPMPNVRSPMPILQFINPRWCMGGVWIHSPADRNDPAARLGPDPLEICQADFSAVLSRRRQIKALLLDQTVLAGMGNIYCDEALFAARIHPRAIASALSQPRRRTLWVAMRDRLTEAIRGGGSSIRDYRDANGQAGWFQISHAAYGRTGLPCPACATPIAHCTAAGRSTHFCPRCQRR
jgi:formamidopyrimidine-DNA glycosylase